ncbi:hypothetical protein ACP6EK_00115 [Candidatus Caldatribacterium sp. SIUC1]|uniref:hypothetical protein n=1 Tax=Candidatus Caldatribacterium sp. SIUC1 TaxID=3418365 RepID=UPI003F694B53
MEHLFSLDGTVDENEARQIEAVRRTVVALQERSLRDDEAVSYLGGYARYKTAALIPTLKRVGMRAAARGLKWKHEANKCCPGSARQATKANA